MAPRRLLRLYPHRSCFVSSEIVAVTVSCKPLTHYTRLQLHKVIYQLACKLALTLKGDLLLKTILQSLNHYAQCIK